MIEMWAWAQVDVLFRHGYERGRKNAAEEITCAVQAVNRDCAGSAGPYDDGYHRGLDHAAAIAREIGANHD